MVTNTVANLEAADEPSINETAVFANISEHGARLVTARHWAQGKEVIVSDALVNFRTRGEVVYCAPYSARRFAVGLKFNWSHALASNYCSHGAHNVVSFPPFPSLFRDVSK
jgi:PilZ domain